MRQREGLSVAVAFLLLTIGVPAADQVASSRAADQTTAAMDRDLVEITIPRLEALYAARKYSVTDITQWYLDRIARYDGAYKAVPHVDAAGARAAAAAEDAAAKNGGSEFTRDLLWGVPIVIKANTSVKGLVTSNGWKGYLIPGHELIAPMDAPVVSKLRAAGAVILGQTNMPDFAASDTTNSSVGGRTGNAYDWRCSPGGSSGGAVTSVAANFTVFGTGTDTSNSIRMPAGTSAVVGVLPTRGLVSIAGMHPLDWLLDDTGPIARTVTDAAIALGVPAFIVKVAVPGVQARGLPLTPDAREMFMKALDGLRQAGATVVIDDSILPDSFLALTGAIKTRPYAREGVESFLRDFGPAGYHSPADYQSVVGSPLPSMILGGAPATQRLIESDPDADATFWGPQRKAGPLRTSRPPSTGSRLSSLRSDPRVGPAR